MAAPTFTSSKTLSTNIDRAWDLLTNLARRHAIFSGVTAVEATSKTIRDGSVWFEAQNIGGAVAHYSVTAEVDPGNSVTLTYLSGEHAHTKRYTFERSTNEDGREQCTVTTTWSGTFLLPSGPSTGAGMRNVPARVTLRRATARDLADLLDAAEYGLPTADPEATFSFHRSARTVPAPAAVTAEPAVQVTPSEGAEVAL